MLAEVRPYAEFVHLMYNHRQVIRYEQTQQFVFLRYPVLALGRFPEDYKLKNNNEAVVKLLRKALGIKE